MICVMVWVEYTHKVFKHIYIYICIHACVATHTHKLLLPLLAHTHIKLMYLQACTQRLVIKILQHSNGKQKV